MRSTWTRAAACAFVAACATVAAAPPAAAAPNPIKALGELRAAWKESEELQLAAKLVRKAAVQQVTTWRVSKGAYCPWRGTRWDGYCSHGVVTTNRPVAILVHGTLLGFVQEGAELQAGCIGSVTGSVRVLWPTPGVPWAWIHRSKLVGGTLPTC